MKEIVIARVMSDKVFEKYLDSISTHLDIHKNYTTGEVSEIVEAYMENIGDPYEGLTFSQISRLNELKEQ